MSGEERRKEIINIIRASASPVSGGRLAELLDCSRQVIVQDIALLRASEQDIISTNKGYILASKPASKTRIFKVCHDDKSTEDELMTIVDLGGKIIDVFVEHNVYGRVSAPLGISCRRDVIHFINNMKNDDARLLKNITSGVHFHTVEADSDEILDEITQALKEKKYLCA